MTTQSILPLEMRGVAYISGYRGIGKSWLAAQADLPGNIAYFDFEDKGAGLDAMLHFGLYRALTVDATRPGQKPDPINLFDVSMAAFDGLEKDRYTVAVLDNISPLETAIKAEALRNIDHYCRVFGLNKGNVLAGRMGGTNSIMNYFIPEIVHRLTSKGIRLVIAIAHISPKWAGGGPIPGKYNVKGGDSWQDLSILTLVLIPGHTPPVPDALVQKEMLGSLSVPSELTAEQLDAMRQGELGHDARRRLPFRIPGCTFAKIRWYLSHPADLANPAEGEVPTDEERNPFDEKLTKEQMAYVMRAMEVNEREESAAQALAQAIPQAKVDDLDIAHDAILATGSPAEIAKEMSTKFGKVVTVPMVLKWRTKTARETPSEA